MKLYTIIAALFSLIILCEALISSPSSVWSRMAQEEKLGRSGLVNCFVTDCAHSLPANNLIPAHIPNQKTMRIATYNIHHWRAPQDTFGSDFDFAHNPNFNKIMQTIEEINADVLILQEMLIFDWKTIQKSFQALGYQPSLTQFIQMATYHDYPFGNIIITKEQNKHSCMLKTYDVQSGNASENCGFVRCIVELPNKKKFLVYGTHLDVHDPTENTRRAQVQELINSVAQEESPSLIAADFNAIRAQDYQYTIENKLVWDLLNDEHAQRVGFAAPTTALNLFKTNNFFDCFSKADQECPKFSVWNGTLVDFIWLNAQWDILVTGCYVYYSDASDHLPIIMDIAIS